ncbi:MAG: hypothetical protein V1495_04715 [Pseudomonadota bacterium]
MTSKLSLILTILALLPWLTAAEAEESIAGHFYATAFISSTPGYLTNQGHLEGWQRDYSPGVSVGYNWTDEWAFGLNLSPNFIRDRYDSLGVIPGAYWSFNSFLFAAFQLYVPVQPTVDFGIEPGIGAYTDFGHGFSPFVEFDVLSIFGREKPDLGFIAILGLEKEF